MGLVVEHRLFEECPEGADPASLGLARVSLARPCGADRLVLGADLLGLGIAMRALLARCSGESTGRLDVDRLGGSRDDGLARQADSPQPIRSSRAPILKRSQRRGSPEGFSLEERGNNFREIYGVMRKNRNDPRSLCFLPSGSPRPPVVVAPPERPQPEVVICSDGSWRTQGAELGYSRCRSVAPEADLMRDDRTRNAPVSDADRVGVLLIRFRSRQA